MNLTMSDWSQIIDGLLAVTAVLFPALALYTKGVKKAKNELIKVINQTPVDNSSILKIAQRSGQTRAVKEIKKLITP